MTANKQGNFLLIDRRKCTAIFQFILDHVCAPKASPSIKYDSRIITAFSKKKKLTTTEFCSLKVYKYYLYGTISNLLDLANDLKPHESRVIFLLLFSVNNILCFWNVDNANAIYDQIKTTSSL